MKKPFRSLTTLVLTTLFLGALAVDAAAEQKFRPDIVISSQTGKWKQEITTKPIVRIDCQVQRISGGDDTYINFRFGDDGHTFPNGQRFAVSKDEVTKLQIPMNGMTSEGKPLVVNAYKGSVKIIHVTVHHKK